MTEKQDEANRKNALRSTGPRTPEGTDGCKMNACRHGIRAVQPVVPGEDAAEWEAHRDAIVDDLGPVGEMELALAELVAAKLWRLRRILAHEAVLIANAQAEDELLRAHEMIHQRESTTPPTRADIPTRNDVASARHAVSAAATKLTAVSAALDELRALASMQDDEVLPSLALYELLVAEFSPAKKDLAGLFTGLAMNMFQVHHAKKLILICFKGKGELDELRVILAAHWSIQLDQLRSDIHNRQAEHESLARRYDEALERRRLASGLPEAKDLERIQRYEAHLERGLHRDLDRLHDLQAARGAVPPRGPSVAVAVIQASPQQAPEETIAPIGSFALEAPEGGMAPIGSFALEDPEGEMGPFGSFDLEAAEMTEGPAGVDAES
jgi:hypothetical protein